MQLNRGKTAKAVNFMDLPDNLFKLHFRISKANVRRVTDLVRRKLTLNSRGSPLSPENHVLVTLMQLGGASFQRITGLASGGISQSCARSATLRTIDAFFELRNNWIKWPTQAEMDDTSLRMFSKYGIPNFFAGIDGCHMRFQKMPKKIPDEHHPDLYVCRKNFYSINAQIISNDRFIYNIDPGWYGSVHDARVWYRSDARLHIENMQGEQMLVGDSAYPISVRLMKPFDTARPGSNEASFNSRLCSIRMLMTEDVYGRMKQRFPFLREIRCELKVAQRKIVVIAMLNNICEMLKDDVPDNSPLVDLNFQAPRPQAVRRNPRFFDNGPRVVSGRDTVRRREGQMKRAEYLQQFSTVRMAR